MALKLDKSQKYLLACSYGPDSMALFSMLKKEGFNFSVAHVNYNLRKEAKLETESLTRYCADMGVELFVHKCGKIDPSLNLEAECRRIRYEFFKKLYNKYDFDAVLVAHNQDDVIETFLMQKNRKSLVNYWGIAEKTNIFDIEVIRPLLDVSKLSLYNYCKENRIPFAIDSTNLTNDFERNKIRHNIVEKMNREKRLNVLGEIEVRNREVRTRIQYLNCLDLNDVKTLLSLDEESFARAMNILVRRFDKAASISMNLAKEIRKVLESPKPNVRMKFNGELFFVKAYDTCTFNGIDHKNYCYVMKTPGVLDTPFFYANFSSGAADRNVTVNDYPLTIRRANANDTVQIKDYDVQVRRLFIDWKMPTAMREKWPVIVNRNGEIIYIPRYKKDFSINSSLNFYVK